MTKMFTKIEDYIKLNRDERRLHLKLNEECVRIGGHASTVYKGLLAHHLKTTIPTSRKVYLCHACNIADCSNVNHLYWGTPKDNYLDSKDVLFGTGPTYESLKLKEHARKMGKMNGGKNKLSNDALNSIAKIIENEPKVWGWKQRASKKLGVTSTQLNRYIKRINSQIPGRPNGVVAS